MVQYIENNFQTPENRNNDLFEYQRVNVQRRLDEYNGFIDPSLS